MKKIFGLIIVLFVISISGCKKDPPDCEANNYGTLKITYGLSNYRHSVIVTLSGTNATRDKISTLGLTSDTLHLKPGTYTLSISSIDSNGLAIDQKNGTSSIKQCDESLTSVSF